MPYSDPAKRAELRFNRYWRKRGVEPPPHPFEYRPGQAGAPIRNYSVEATETRERVRQLRAGAPLMIAAKGSPEAAANKVDCAKRTREELSRRCRQYALDHKLSHPCVDCGEADPRCLDFDHRDHATKSFNISDYTSSKRSIALSRLEAEIAKCDVRCANCHRKKTIENQDFIALEDWERDDWEGQI